MLDKRIGWQFDNTYSSLPESMLSKLSPTPVKAPEIVIFNVSLSKKLGLPQKLREVDIPKNACEKMAKDAMKQTRLLVNNPREVTEKDPLNIYHSAW